MNGNDVCHFLAIASKRKDASSTFLLFSTDWMQITPLALSAPPTPNCLRLGGTTGWSHCEERLHLSAGNIHLVFFSLKKKKNPYLFILFLAVLSLCGHQDFSVAAVSGLLSAVAALVAEHGCRK